jgi:ABC-type multidrug transport system fused ATPase/permease subunit
VAILSLYAMAGYRLLPAAQIAFRSATTIRANVDALQSLEPAIRLGREVETPNEPTVELLALGAVEFRNVGFHYPETTKPVLEDVSFRIEPNTITAIVGTSGSGKSTIASLLLGLLRPATGDITVAGQSIRTCTRSWQDRLAYVSQHVFLVDDSIATNIALGSRGAPDLGRVERAARQASLSAFIESLPARYDHGVGEHGSLLSGGQRQRIGIARALYNDADVIVLDEPTSALDSATEAGIIATLEGLRATKTIVMISHRMSTLRSADRILMLAEGRVHAFGTFDELFERVESFRKLVLSEVTESAADGTGRSGESISATA